MTPDAAPVYRARAGSTRAVPCPSCSCGLGTVRALCHGNVVNGGASGVHLQWAIHPGNPPFDVCPHVGDVGLNGSNMGITREGEG